MSVAAAGVGQPPAASLEKRGQMLVLGRALHPPWTEGTRVINRNFARVAHSQRAVRVVSVTDSAVQPLAADTLADDLPVEHVFTDAGYSLRGIQLAVPRVVRHLARSGTSDIEVAHVFGLPLSLAPWLHHRGIRVVAHVMAVSQRPRDRLIVRASTMLFKRWIDAFAVSSAALVPSVSACGVPAARLIVVPPAIDTAVFCRGERETAKGRMGIDPSELLVIYLGRLSARRFPAEVVAQALAHAAVGAPRPVRFVALSPERTFDGSENTAQYLLECSRLAEMKLRGLPGVAIDIRLGSLDESAKVNVFQAADAVLLPFTAPEAVEPPLTLIEAMACEATVLVTPAANRSGLIRSDHNGFVAETPVELAQQLAAVLHAPDGFAELGRNARLSALERHSFAAVAAATSPVWARTARLHARDAHS
jgi:glycosyltransferase involved in cell wall biosynthesis